MDNNENKNMPVNPQQPKDLDSQMTEFPGVKVQGHIKIFDPETQEVYVNKRNAIHYENFSLALVNSVANMGYGMISNMSFGNGGSRVDPTGIITYLTPNTVGTNATLYNETYTKIIDASNTSNVDPTRNYMETRHILGNTYTDLLVSCLLDFGEPSGQNAFDNSTDANGNFVFDEIGLLSYSPNGPGAGSLLTHVIFHPVQKSLNRMIQIDYTVRIQSLTSGI